MDELGRPGEQRLPRPMMILAWARNECFVRGNLASNS